MNKKAMHKKPVNTKPSSNKASNNLPSSNTNGLFPTNPGMPPAMANTEPATPPDPTGLINLNKHWSYDPHTHTIGLTTLLAGLDHARLEAQLIESAASINADGWTVFIEYFATGEGTHIWYKRVHGGTKAEAIEDFRATFFAEDTDQAWAFWSVGMMVHPGAFWPAFVTGYRIPPDSLEMHWESQF